MVNTHRRRSLPGMAHLVALGCLGSTHCQPTRTVHTVQADASTGSVARAVVPVAGLSFDLRAALEPQVTCYCLYTLATHDLDHPLLHWMTVRPVVSPTQVLLALAPAASRCAFPAVQRPRITAAEVVGRDVTITGTFAGPGGLESFAAALVPAPGAGGHLVLEMQGSIVGGGSGQTERCTVPVVN